MIFEFYKYCQIVYSSLWILQEYYKSSKRIYNFLISTTLYDIFQNMTLDHMLHKWQSFYLMAFHRYIWDSINLLLWLLLNSDFSGLLCLIIYLYPLNSTRFTYNFAMINFMSLWTSKTHMLLTRFTIIHWIWNCLIHWCNYIAGFIFGYVTFADVKLFKLWLLKKGS